jgi:Lrp/AsnC family transcriptional regulator, leucine-responsive regulatory protein
MLDEIDIQILDHLQTNARASHAEIGRLVGLTASSVYERVRKLEERGVIQGYRALVDPAALGKTITAFVRVRVNTENPPFEAAVRAEPDVQECFIVTGEDCYILKVRARNTAELHQTLLRLRAAADGASSITMIVLHCVKENGPMAVVSNELVMN